MSDTELYNRLKDIEHRIYEQGRTISALVNAVRELNSRLDKITGKVSALWATDWK